MKIETENEKAYIDITIDSQKVGRIVFKLYDNLAPQTCENFLNLCKGITLGVSDNEILYTYKGNQFNRVIKNFVIQAGDLNGGNVSTIYGSDTTRPIPAENLCDEMPPFKLCLANNGDVNANGSQFFITTYPQPHLAKKHSVFGEVIHGKSVIREIERVKTNLENVPEVAIIIESCGVWNEDMGVPVYNASYDSISGDIYEEYPEDDTNFDQESTQEAYDAACKMKESGAQLFKMGKKQDAWFKWRKCLRYIVEFDPDQDQNPELYVKFKELKKKVYLNLSLVCLQLENHQKAIDYSTFLLDMDAKVSQQDRAKALFRRGSSYFSLKKFENSLRDLKEAHEIVPDDKVISAKMTAVEKAIAQKKENEKSKYAKFFG